MGCATVPFGSIIDSQAYNNYLWYGFDTKTLRSEYFGNGAHTNYANDYYNSSIRNWLTVDFYATAFSESQQNKLLKYNCDNSSAVNSLFDSQNSSDKVFLLSYDEVTTAEYGFNSNDSTYDTSRIAKGTDYAKCQGLYVSSGNSLWWLRSPGARSDKASVVGYRGSCSLNGVNLTFGGVRPALRLNLLEITIEIIKAEAKAELAEAKKNAVSDEAKTILDNAIASVENAANVNDVLAITSNAKSDAENADKQAMLDKVVIKVASAQTIDYRSIVTITATAENVPDDCKLVLYVNGSKVATGDNKSVSYSVGELKSDINYTVKVVDANGNVQKDSSGNELSKDGDKISSNAGFFKKLIAFFKGLFKSLPKVEVKPQ